MTVDFVHGMSARTDAVGDRPECAAGVHRTA